MRFGVSIVVVLIGIGTLIIGETSNNTKEQACPVAEDNEISQEKLEETIKQLMESLKKQGFSEEELLSRVERDSDGKIDNRSYEEKCKDTCGEGQLTRCPREFKPIAGHICENTEPLEPRGPFCNCPFCTGKEDTRKEVREVDFEESEAMKSESAKHKLSTSVYHEKWAANKFSCPITEEKKFKMDFMEGMAEDLPRRNLFSCQRTDSIYDAEKAPVRGDPEFQEQFRSLTEEEQQPSLGILKYHEKRSREEEGEL